MSLFILIKVLWSLAIVFWAMGMVANQFNKFKWFDIFMATAVGSAILSAILFIWS